MNFGSIQQLTADATAAEVQGTVMVQVTKKLTKTTKTGKPYLEVELADAAGSFSLKIWDNAPWHPAFNALQPNDAIAVTGTWSVNEYGLNGSALDCRRLTPEEEEQMLSGSPELCARRKEDWAGILALIASMRDPRLRTLCETVTEKYGARFRRSGAARMNHHARRGGLVEHVASVMRVADALCAAYPSLNRDLVLAGALLHDCGKMWENVYEEHSLVMPYSLTGELLGHIPVGIELVNRLWGLMLTAERREAWQTLTPATEQVRLHLLHLIASHHGTLEYGSPVVPKTPEALALHHADDIDAKMEMYRTVYAESQPLSEHVVQRKFPLPGNAVVPLPSFEGGEV